MLHSLCINYYLFFKFTVCTSSNFGAAKKGFHHRKKNKSGTFVVAKQSRTNSISKYLNGKLTTNGDINCVFNASQLFIPLFEISILNEWAQYGVYSL